YSPIPPVVLRPGTGCRTHRGADSSGPALGRRIRDQGVQQSSRRGLLSGTRPPENKAEVAPGQSGRGNGSTRIPILWEAGDSSAFRIPLPHADYPGRVAKIRQIPAESPWNQAGKLEGGGKQGPGCE